MAGQLQAITQKDFSQGENLVTNPYDIGEKQSLRAVNLILDEHGSLRTVDGTKIQTSAPASEAGNRLLLPFSWTQVNGTINKTVIVRSGAVSKVYNRATTPWTLVGTFTTNDLLPQTVVFTNLQIWTDGYNVPKKWDGAVFAALGGGLVGAKHLVLHQGFLWAGNTAAATTATDGPSVLRQSDLNSPEVWNAANVQFLAKDDGQEITGFGLFTIAETGISPTSVLIVFKRESAFQVTGNMGTGGGLPSSNFAIQKIKSDMGCTAPRSIQFVAGFGIIRLTHRGFALYDGVDDRLISEEERPRIFGRDDISGIDLTNAQYSVASQCQNPPIYFCLCPLSGTALTRAFCYDLVRRAWTIVDFPFSLAWASLITEPNTLPQILLADATAGNVRRWFAGDSTFDATAISWSWRTRPALLKSQLTPLYFRRMILDLLAPTGATINYNATFTNAQVQGLSTQTFQPQASGGQWGLSKWGQFIWGQSGGNLIGDQPTLELDVNATNGFLDLSGTGAVRLRGLEWHVRQKPYRSFRT